MVPNKSLSVSATFSGFGFTTGCRLGIDIFYIILFLCNLISLINLKMIFIGGCNCQKIIKYFLKTPILDKQTVNKKPYSLPWNHINRFWTGSWATISRVYQRLTTNFGWAFAGTFSRVDCQATRRIRFD